MSLTDLDDEALFAAVAAHEEELQFDSFSNSTAHELGARLVEKAKAAKLPIAIDITRAGHRLFHMAMDGAAPDNAEWIERKNRVVNRFHHSSLYMGLSCKIAGVGLEERYLLEANIYAPHGGAFPIILKETGVIGTITVSGLPQVEDHALVVSVIREFLA